MENNKKLCDKCRYFMLMINNNLICKYHKIQMTSKIEVCVPNKLI